MSCHDEPDPLRDNGAISPAVTAGLAGIDQALLERWWTTGLLPSSTINDDPDREEFDDPLWYVSWNDHHRVLAAAKLLELGLAESDLPAALSRLDEACPQWAVTLVPRAIEAALPEEIDRTRFFAERGHEGPLGKLFRFADSVEMRPYYCEGAPTVRGRRIRTAMLWLEYPAASDADDIAGWYSLTAHQVRRAIEFEEALRVAEQPYVPAAG